MPPDPPRWAEEVDAPPSVSQGDLVVAEQSTLEERVQAGQVSRAYLAGRAYARRWLGADPAVRAAEVAVILARHPYLPNSVDSALMRFAAHHVGLGPGGRQNRVDVRAGFSAAVRRLAGVTGPDGVDTLAPGRRAGTGRHRARGRGRPGACGPGGLSGIPADRGGSVSRDR